MKYILLLLFPLSVQAQVTEVVEVPGLTKDQIFISARQWVVTSFVDSKEVLQLSDKETGEISGAGISSVVMKLPNFAGNQPVWFRFRVAIWCKDGKYKYSFSDFSDAYVGKPGDTRNLLFRSFEPAETKESNVIMMGKKKNQQMYEDLKAAINKNMTSTAESLKASVNKKPVDF